jgi:NAD-dependent oxidoreductase involved in siderophore biosynthesis
MGACVPVKRSARGGTGQTLCALLFGQRRRGLHVLEDRHGDPWRDMG